MFSKAPHAELANSLESIGAGVAVFQVDRNTDVVELVSANSRFCELVHMSIPQVLSKNLSDIFPRYVATHVEDAAKVCIESQRPGEFEIPLNSFGRNSFWRCFVSPIATVSKFLPRVILTLTDITEKKSMELELSRVNERFQAVVESAYDGILTVDATEHVRLANQAAKDIFRKPDIEGILLSELVPQRFRAKHHQYVQSFRDSEVKSRPMFQRATIQGLRSDGQEVPLEITISRIQLHQETELMAVIRDISERQRLIDELQQAATTDQLTGLYNRRHFVPIIEAEVDRSTRYDGSLVLFMIDLDHFKEVNDNWGHKKGDEFLQSMAKVLNEHLRKIDTLCRWGGEEFLVLAPELSAKGALELGEKIRSLIGGIEIGSGESALRVTASIGVADITEMENPTYESFIERADKLMYEAKKRGRNQVVSSLS